MLITIRATPALRQTATRWWSASLATVIPSGSIRLPQAFSLTPMILQLGEMALSQSARTIPSTQYGLIRPIQRQRQRPALPVMLHFPLPHLGRRGRGHRLGRFRSLMQPLRPASSALRRPWTRSIRTGVTAIVSTGAKVLISMWGPRTVMTLT